MANSNPMKPYVFLCHVQTDKPRLVKLFNSLVRRGIPIFVDDVDGVGLTWDEDVLDKLKDFVVRMPPGRVSKNNYAVLRDSALFVGLISREGFYRTLDNGELDTDNHGAAQLQDRTAVSELLTAVDFLKEGVLPSPLLFGLDPVGQLGFDDIYAKGLNVKDLHALDDENNSDKPSEWRWKICAEQIAGAYHALGVAAENPASLGELQANAAKLGAPGGRLHKEIGFDYIRLPAIWIPEEAATGLGFYLSRQPFILRGTHLFGKAAAQQLIDRGPSTVGLPTLEELKCGFRGWRDRLASGSSFGLYSLPQNGPFWVDNARKAVCVDAALETIDDRPALIFLRE